LDIIAPELGFSSRLRLGDHSRCGDDGQYECPADASGCRSPQVLNLKESTNISGPILRELIGKNKGKLMVHLGRPFEHNRVTAIEYGLIAAVKAIKYGVIAITMVSILGAVGVNPIAVFSEVIRGLQLP
jgi:hypothetical protein